MFELGAHVVDLIGDVFMIGGEIADVGEIGDSFLPLSTLGEPSRCFSAQEHAKEKDTAGDKLKTEGNHPVMSEQALKSGIPLLIVAGKVAVDTIGDPETKDLFY
jgi:hypothetical protein